MMLQFKSCEAGVDRVAFKLCGNARGRRVVTEFADVSLKKECKTYFVKLIYLQKSCQSLVTKFKNVIFSKRWSKILSRKRMHLKNSHQNR